MKIITKYRTSFLITKKGTSFEIPFMREMGLEKIFYPRNPVKRRITTSTPLGYLIGYLKYYMGTSPKKNL